MVVPAASRKIGRRRLCPVVTANLPLASGVTPLNVTGATENDVVPTVSASVSKAYPFVGSLTGRAPPVLSVPAVVSN